VLGAGAATCRPEAIAGNVGVVGASARGPCAAVSAAPLSSRALAPADDASSSAAVSAPGTDAPSCRPEAFARTLGGVVTSARCRCAAVSAAPLRSRALVPADDASSFEAVNAPGTDAASCRPEAIAGTLGVLGASARCLCAAVSAAPLSSRAALAPAELAAFCAREIGVNRNPGCGSGGGTL